jgi:hypothetical protein
MLSLGTADSAAVSAGASRAYADQAKLKPKARTKSFGRSIFFNDIGLV